MSEAKYHIMVVDDDIGYTDLLAKELEQLGEVEKAYSIEDFFSKYKPFQYDLILLDLRLKVQKEGLDILKYIKEEDPNTTVVVISAYGDVATAVEALQMGAKTFLEKDKCSFKEILLICQNILKELKIKRQLGEVLKEEIPLVGNDLKIQIIKKQINFIASEELPVLLRGEFGVGKRHTARIIHRTGKRKEEPFIVFNPGEYPEDEVIKELYNKNSPGAIYKAHKGVLVINDIAELPLKAQNYLWKVLQNDKRPDFQLIAITEHPLEQLVFEGKFHRELFYFLKTTEITIPPLRERKGDIPLLSEHFIKNIEKKCKVRKLSKSAKEILQKYSFPGNVAELKTILEAGAVKAYTENSEVITTRHLPIPSADEEPSFQIRGKVKDINKFLSEIEIHLINEAMKGNNWKKQVVSQQLGYPSRFSMLKRVKKIFKKYPELKTKYRELAAAYKVL